jgi:hypothetical protein
VPDDRPLHEVLFEYAVYVPIGIAASVAEQLPELTEKGRRLAGTRIHLARLMGEFAVGHAQRRVGHILSSNGRSGGGTRTAPAGLPSRYGPDSVVEDGAASSAVSPDISNSVVGVVDEPAEAISAPTPAKAPAPRRPRRPRQASVPSATSGAAGESPVAVTQAPVVELLAIPAYDTLAASQVVQRLSSLEPDELEAVRRYELATRGRRTILHRVAQLNAAAGRTPI